MEYFKKNFIIAAGGLIIAVIAVSGIIIYSNSKPVSPWRQVIKNRQHLDHSGFFPEKIETPQEVTAACLKCHENAAKDLMKTAHWNWERTEDELPGHGEKMRIGKKNLLNNFCLGIQGNWRTCNSCHAGYGWKDNTFDFKDEKSVDCLVCHDWSGTYSKGDYGMPKKDVNLAAVAGSVGYPKRDNCGTCHNFGGGGMGVKHGDLDQSLVYAKPGTDAHMGKNKLLCIDCHKTENHNIKGKSFAVSVSHTNGIGCTDCHRDVPHKDRRINTHLDSLACQTCHIPQYSKRAPTKSWWDWSKAGDAGRKEDPHNYLKIKGEFEYEEAVNPEYAWFSLSVDRYLARDKFDPSKVLEMNPPRGDITDAKAKIWPFKIHRAKQPYDKVHRHLLQPVTSGEGGFWSEFNWDKSFRLAEKLTGIEYSGSYGFAETRMHWPLSHMISPASQALRCDDCHGKKTRFNWKALGYPEDPADLGGRRHLKLIKE
jgi:octaheme c-type cytochrome (tetrathionate reductase family)